MKSLTPKEIVAELDRNIVGQSEAKKAVAIALRNRWRRQQVNEDLREEILPKNILMIGPTGVGKTEIARRLAKLSNAPFVKVEATKFTEVGYVGRDVEQIVRDLVEIAIINIKEDNRKTIEPKAILAAQERILDVLVGDKSTDETRKKFKAKLESGALDKSEIEIKVQDNSSASMPTIDVPGMPGAQMGMINLSDILGKGMGTSSKNRKMTIADAMKVVTAEEVEKLIDQEKIITDAIELVEQNGIVFIDEIDKICGRNDNRGEVSREGVQRDLLPLIEGTTVSTKHGAVKTNHILFITSGAFHLAKPSDLLPELQGRLPIRVEMKSLSKDDFARILIEPEASLIRQYEALIATEGVKLSFSPDSVDVIATLAEDINKNVEDIGARRLHALLEKLLEEISFNASDMDGDDVAITGKVVNDSLGDLVKATDVSKFIL